MNLTALHRRLLADVLAIGTPYPLVITGGYAAQAHGLVDRLSQDIDVATENPAPMGDIVRSLERGLTDRGWRVDVISVDPLSARLLVSSDTGEQCEVDVLKENLWAHPMASPHGPVLALDDVIGTKVRALADRAAVRDFIDVRAASASHDRTPMWGPRHPWRAAGTDPFGMYAHRYTGCGEPIAGGKVERAVTGRAFNHVEPASGSGVAQGGAYVAHRPAVASERFALLCHPCTAFPRLAAR